MFTFPESIAQLVFQYPTAKQISISTKVMQFVGGGEQRYRIGSVLRQWHARPTQLPEKELAELTSFFDLVASSGSSFAFTDVWDGTLYPTCFFKENDMQIVLRFANKAAVEFTIMEGASAS